MIDKVSRIWGTGHLTPLEAQQLLIRMREQRERDSQSHGWIRLVGQARQFADLAAIEGDAPTNTVLTELGIMRWLAISDTPTVGDDAYFTGTAEVVNALVAAACPGSKPIAFGEKQAGQVAVAELRHHLDNFV